MFFNEMLLTVMHTLRGDLQGPIPHGPLMEGIENIDCRNEIPPSGPFVDLRWGDPEDGAVA
jgi:hypothetical protein